MRICFRLEPKLTSDHREIAGRQIGDFGESGWCRLGEEAFEGTAGQLATERLKFQLERETPLHDTLAVALYAVAG